MKSDIIFKTKKRNDYLLDKNKELVVFLPPDLKSAIENPDKDNSQYYLYRPFISVFRNKMDFQAVLVPV
ncbi:MAG: hypothetical protein LBU37_07300 [Tannerellaceae bacterium]|jgi:hypothetical protein|nr:hypothetical protein [Tannerellaceae bacterium]